MLPVQSDCIDTHEDAEDRTKRLYWIGDVEAPRHGAVQFARLQARRRQVPVPAEPEEEDVVARRVTAVSVMTKGRRGVCELASGREAVSS